MNYVKSSLRSHIDVIGPVAAGVTILQFLSGSFICKDIYYKGSTKGTSATPFIGGVGLGILVLKLAILLKDNNMFNVNMAAIIFNVIYLGFYAAYAQDRKKEVWIPSAKGCTLVVTLLVYVAFEEEHLVKFRYSFIMTVLMLLLLGSPLKEISDIIAKRDASSIPFPMAFMGFIVSFLWLLYGLGLDDNFMIIQNTVGGIICLAQIILWFILPAKSKKSKKTD